jgi:hypothetical protein
MLCMAGGLTVRNASPPKRSVRLPQSAYIPDAWQDLFPSDCVVFEVETAVAASAPHTLIVHVFRALDYESDGRRATIVAEAKRVQCEAEEKEEEVQEGTEGEAAPPEAVTAVALAVASKEARVKERAAAVAGLKDNGIGEGGELGSKDSSREQGGEWASKDGHSKSSTVGIGIGNAAQGAWPVAKRQKAAMAESASLVGAACSISSQSSKAAGRGQGRGHSGVKALSGKAQKVIAKVRKRNMEVLRAGLQAWSAAACAAVTAALPVADQQPRAKQEQKASKRAAKRGAAKQPVQRKVAQKAKRQPPKKAKVAVDGDECFCVEEIRGKRVVGGEPQYLIK